MTPKNISCLQRYCSGCSLITNHNNNNCHSCLQLRFKSTRFCVTTTGGQGKWFKPDWLDDGASFWFLIGHIIEWVDSNATKGNQTVALNLAYASSSTLLIGSLCRDCIICSALRQLQRRTAHPATTQWRTAGPALVQLYSSCYLFCSVARDNKTPKSWWSLCAYPHFVAGQS